MVLVPSLWALAPLMILLLPFAYAGAICWLKRRFPDESAEQLGRALRSVSPLGRLENRKRDFEQRKKAA